MLDADLMDALARRPPIWGAGAQDWWDFTRSGRAKRGVGAMPAETRASDGFAQNEAGVWVRRSANTRSMAGNGLLTYPTRTNSLRNNTMVGAVAGTPGTAPTNWSVIGNNGLSVASIALETMLGFTVLAVTWTGTASATGGIFTELDVAGAIAASVGQVWTQSWFVSLTVNSGATPTFVSRISYRDAGGTSLGQTDAAFVPTASLERYSNVGGGAPASTASIIPTLRTGVTNGQPYNYTVRIAVPQLELGAFASPPILTAGSAVTANGPQQVIDIGSRAALGVGGVIQVDFRNTPTSGSVRVLEISDGLGGAGTGAILYYASGNLRMQVFASSVGQGAVDLGTWPTGLATIAFVAGSNITTGRIYGQSAPTPDTTVTWPANLSKVIPGGEGASAGQNNYQLSKRLALWYGPMSQHFFDNVLWPKAQLLAQVA